MSESHSLTAGGGFITDAPSVQGGGFIVDDPKTSIPASHKHDASIPTSTNEQSSSTTTPTPKPAATIATTTAATNAPSTATSSEPTLYADLSPEVRARIEKNRDAAKERYAIYQRRQAMAKALEEDFEKDSTGLTKGKAAAEIDKAMREIEPLPKNNWTKFYDYDLSKMKDTRGGFIQDVVDESEQPADANARLLALAKSLQQREALDDAEAEMQLKRKWQPTLAEEDPSIFLGAEGNPECQDCTSVDVDFQILRHFNVGVCIGCRDQQPEKYSLLTKTECRQDYLLTDPELRDRELFPWWERPNPKKATWNNMMLYLRCQVEAYAYEKWGGPEGLDAEFERRERQKEERKEKKFKQELRDLRNKTRTSVWQDRKIQKRPKTHQHDFGVALVDPKTGASVQTCVECGIQVECEEF
ncbi:hypothetical protein DFQ27_004939 [Actinomortierella ambigua]|uniref:XPA C-terminal domain-containing protein n=1 Tax=Actinomortierella ambigua TaxID=1343610 RepID=A0A9P6U2J7_9FUNG|nr:hypothetical protein DFQ27_004939 [Actinomortierella ambigua]